MEEGLIPNTGATVEGLRETIGLDITTPVLCLVQHHCDKSATVEKKSERKMRKQIDMFDVSRIFSEIRPNSFSNTTKLFQ